MHSELSQNFVLFFEGMLGGYSDMGWMWTQQRV